MSCFHDDEQQASMVVDFFLTTDRETFSFRDSDSGMEEFEETLEERRRRLAVKRAAVHQKTSENE